MKASTIYRFGLFSARHPVKAIDILSSFYFERESVKTARHPLGENIFVLLPDWGSIRLYMGEVLEPDVVAFMKLVLKPGMTVFDIGANIGYHSVGARHLVGDKGKVIAFEPVHYLHEVLNYNLSQYKNTTLEKLAVSDGKQSEIALRFYGIKFSAQTTSKEEPRAEADYASKFHKPQELIVSATSIDDYVAKSGYIPDLMKLDIENGEMNALRGGEGTISKYNPFIIIEGGDISRIAENSTLSCLDLLGKFGYHFFEFDDKKSLILPHKLKDTYEEGCNILCTPK